jgi:hypothetical protein
VALAREFFVIPTTNHSNLESPHAKDPAMMENPPSPKPDPEPSNSSSILLTTAEHID